MRCLEGAAGGEANPGLFTSVDAGGLPPSVVVTAVENRLPRLHHPGCVLRERLVNLPWAKHCVLLPSGFVFCFKWKLMEEAHGLSHLEDGPALLH